MPLRLPGTPDPQAPPEWRAPRPGQEALEWLSQVFGGPESLAGLAAPIGLVGYKALAKEAPDLIEVLRRVGALKRMSHRLDPTEGLALSQARSAWAEAMPAVAETAVADNRGLLPWAPSFLRDLDAGPPLLPEVLYEQQFPKLQLLHSSPRLRGILEEMAGLRIRSGGTPPMMPRTEGGQERLKADILRRWRQLARTPEELAEIQRSADLPLEHWRERVFPFLDEESRQW